MNAMRSRIATCNAAGGKAFADHRVKATHLNNAENSG